MWELIYQNSYMSLSLYLASSYTVAIFSIKIKVTASKLSASDSDNTIISRLNQGQNFSIIPWFYPSFSHMRGDGQNIDRWIIVRIIKGLQLQILGVEQANNFQQEGLLTCLVAIFLKILEFIHGYHVKNSIISYINTKYTTCIYIVILYLTL